MKKVITLIITLFLVPSYAFAQDFSISLGDGLPTSALAIFFLVALIGLIPGLMLMMTCFPFIITVLSILRQALGLQQSPPNMMLVSLALFLTYFVMDPVFRDSWENGFSPFLSERLDFEAAFFQAIQPFKAFMVERTDPQNFQYFSALRPEFEYEISDATSVPLSILVPSFVISEIELAFKIGFLIFLPFLIIDLVVAAILMSMGMMMVPPAIVSLPFKLAFFVVADGWSLVASALVQSYF